MFTFKRKIKNLLFLLSGGYRPKIFWDNWADDFMNDPWQKKIQDQHQYLLHKINQTNPKTILEIGCGFGRNIKFLIEKGIDPKIITGVDISPKMLRKAKDYIGNTKVNLEVADFTKLPFKDKSFDFVFLHGVFMHAKPKDFMKALNEVLRVSRKYVVFIEQNYQPKEEGLYTFVHNYSDALENYDFKHKEYRNYDTIGLDFWYVEIR